MKFYIRLAFMELKREVAKKSELTKSNKPLPNS